MFSLAAAVSVPARVPSAMELLHKEVTLEGLSARADLNGERGTVISFNGERYGVELQVGEKILVKPANLALVPGALINKEVTIEGLSARADLNGERGTVISFDGERYGVELQVGEKIRVKPANLALVPEVPLANNETVSLKSAKKAFGATFSISTATRMPSRSSVLLWSRPAASETQ